MAMKVVVQCVSFSCLFLAAAEGEEVDKLLANTVIIIDPSFNPDGLNRFTTWQICTKKPNSSS
jgi:murein tripeptide amidase MpaA